MLPINDAGSYDVQVMPQTAEEPYFQTIGKDATDAIVFTLQTTDGSHYIKYYSYLTPKSAPYTEERMSQLFGAEWMDKINNGVDPFSGVSLQVVVEMETYNGKTRARAKYLNKPGGQAMGARKIAAVLETLRKARGTANRQQAPVQVAAPQSQPQPRRMVRMDELGDSAPPFQRAKPAVQDELEGDDIPF